MTGNCNTYPCEIYRLFKLHNCIIFIKVPKNRGLLLIRLCTCYLCANVNLVYSIHNTIISCCQFARLLHFPYNMFKWQVLWYNPLMFASWHPFGCFCKTSLDLKFLYLGKIAFISAYYLNLHNLLYHNMHKIHLFCRKLASWLLHLFGVLSKIGFVDFFLIFPLWPL